MGSLHGPRSMLRASRFGWLMNHPLCLDREILSKRRSRLLVAHATTKSACGIIWPNRRQTNVQNTRMIPTSKYLIGIAIHFQRIIILHSESPKQRTLFAALHMVVLRTATHNIITTQGIWYNICILSLKDGRASIQCNKLKTTRSERMAPDLSSKPMTRPPLQDIGTKSSAPRLHNHRDIMPKAYTALTAVQTRNLDCALSIAMAPEPRPSANTSRKNPAQHLTLMDELLRRLTQNT